MRMGDRLWGGAGFEGHVPYADSAFLRRPQTPHAPGTTMADHEKGGKLYKYNLQSVEN